MSRVGSNMMLAATLACLSYVPFEYVAKGSLLFAVLLFIMDPIPPVSRLLSLILVVGVGVLSKLHRKFIQDEIENHDDGITIVVNSDTTNQYNESNATSIVESSTTSVLGTKKVN